MNSNLGLVVALGLVGAFFLAIGGAILFEGLYELFNINNYGVVEPTIDFIGFTGFLFAGIGLWLIVLSGKPEMEGQREKEVTA